MPEPIYKICSKTEWDVALAEGVYRGSAADTADGFIHFSTANQVRATAQKHFARQTDLVLIRVDPETLGDALKWEPSRGGALFPHLYGPLSMDAAQDVVDLPCLNGYHEFPAGIA